MENISITEAIKQGYKYYGYKDQEWQHVMDINDITSIDFERGIPMLFSKESNNPSIDTESIAELLAEHIEINHYDETRDDTNEVYSIVKKLDFSQTEKMINDALSNYKCYTLTNIMLVLDNINV